MRILSLSCAFPNPNEPGYGNFVRARLEAMAALAEIQVIAPVPVVDYSRGRKGWRCARVPDQRRDDRIQIFHPRWLYLPGGPSLNALLLFAQLVWPITKLQRHFAFERIDAHFGFPDGIAAALLAQCFHVPFSVTLRGNETMHAERSRWIRALMSWSFRRAASIIALSSGLRDFAITMGANPESVRVIPNGVNARVFFPRDRLTIREELGIEPGAKIIMSVGSLIERKGHHHVIQALAKMKTGCENALLMIAGGLGREGDYTDQLQRLPAALGISGRVRFLGDVAPAELAKWLSAADVFCLASSREGSPNVVLEAAACGTPVVATEVGGVGQLITSARYGLVVPAGDQQALESALRRALGTAWDREAIHRWSQTRSWRHVAEEVIEQFESVGAGVPAGSAS